MKNVKYIFVMLVTVFAITSCDVNTEVEFDHTYKSDLAIDIPSGAKSVQFSEKTVLDPYSSDDFAQYAELINDIRINGIGGLIATINKTITVTDLQLIFRYEGEKIEFSKPSVVFEEGAVITFEESEEDFAKLASWLKDKRKVEVEILGTSSEDDVQATFTTETGVTVTAEPL